MATFNFEEKDAVSTVNNIQRMIKNDDFFKREIDVSDSMLKEFSKKIREYFIKELIAVQNVPIAPKPAMYESSPFIGKESTINVPIKTKDVECLFMKDGLYFSGISEGIITWESSKDKAIKFMNVNSAEQFKIQLILDGKDFIKEASIVATSTQK